MKYIIYCNEFEDYVSANILDIDENFDGQWWNRDINLARKFTLCQCYYFYKHYDTDITIILWE